MTIWPASVAARVAIALAVAVLGVVALAIGVEHADAASRDVHRAAPAPVVPSAPRIGFSLAPVGGRIVLASRVDAVAPDVAPLVQVFADGSAALRRPAPLARGPGAPAVAGDAAIVLPGALPRLDPLVRGTLVELLGQLLGERPVPRARLATVGVGAADRDVTVLLEWVR